MKKISSVIKRSIQFKKQRRTIKKYVGGGIYVFDNSIVRSPKLLDVFNWKLFLFGLIKLSRTRRSNIQIKSSESKIVYCTEEYAICFYKSKDELDKFLKNEFVDKIPYPKVDEIERHESCIVYKRAHGNNPKTYAEVKKVCLLAIDCMINKITFDAKECLSINQGDFSQSNVFITSDGYFECIDFDNAGFYPLLNDVFSIILMPYIYHYKTTFVPLLKDADLLNSYNQLKKKLNINFTFMEIFYNYFKYWQINSKKGFYMFGEPYRDFFKKDISSYKDIVCYFKNA